MFHFPTNLPLAPAPESVSTAPGTVTETPLGLRIEGHGPAIVLLHSSMGSKSQWRTLMERMRATHRLIAIDLHGYGDAAMPERPNRFSLTDEVRLVQSKLAQVLAQDERYHLVGHSFGGGVALRLAHADLKRIRSLCLYEPTAFHLLDRNDHALQEVRAVARATEAAVCSGQHIDATEMFIDYWSGTGTYAALPPSRQALFAALLPKVPLDFQALINDPLHAFDYRRIGAPSCLITGRASPDCAHAVATVLAAALPDSETHRIDAGHMGPLTHPAVVNPVIDEFIRRIDARDKKIGSCRFAPEAIAMRAAQ